MTDAPARIENSELHARLMRSLGLGVGGNDLSRNELGRNELNRNELSRGSGTMRAAVPTGILHKELSYAVVGAAIEVHRHIGPGQLEATYERALASELTRREIAYRRQAPLSMAFKGEEVGEFYADLIVEEKIIIELKSVIAVHHVHKMQVLSYLRASGLRLGLLINFNAPVLWRAITRIVL